jgi:hypothetical protein
MWVLDHRVVPVNHAVSDLGCLLASGEGPGSGVKLMPSAVKRAVPGVAATRIVPVAVKLPPNCRGSAW